MVETNHLLTSAHAIVKSSIVAMEKRNLFRIEFFQLSLHFTQRVRQISCGQISMIQSLGEIGSQWSHSTERSLILRWRSKSLTFVRVSDAI